MQMTFDFTPAKAVLARADSNDYHHVPVSNKQVLYARQIAQRSKVALPETVLCDRQKLSAWIDKNAAGSRTQSRFSNYPSSKQVAFAERIARLKRRSVPDECFRDRTLMSRWIDSNI